MGSSSQSDDMMTTASPSEAYLDSSMYIAPSDPLDGMFDFNAGFDWVSVSFLTHASDTDICKGIFDNQIRPQIPDQFTPSWQDFNNFEEQNQGNLNF
jgi:hypothetical protein